MFKKIVFSTIIGLNTLLYANINAVVSILPQQIFVEKIGGEKVDVTTMVKPGSDPHTYTPKPSQMVAFSRAAVYFPIKIEFENAWLEKFIYHNQTMKISEMTKGIKFLNAQQSPYEWVGLFKLEKGEYHWNFSKISGKYADPKMKFLMLYANEKNPLIYDYREAAKKLFRGNKLTSLKDGDHLNQTKSLYALQFDASKNQTTFTIEIQKSGYYLFFTEHMPFEFKNEEHYFKNSTNVDIKAIESEPKNGSAHHHGSLDPHTWTAPSKRC